VRAYRPAQPTAPQFARSAPNRRKRSRHRARAPHWSLYARDATLEFRRMGRNSGTNATNCEDV
jgi:hypothetical protein